MKNRLKFNKYETTVIISQEVFMGNLLDIGTDNYGIIYNMYKKYNSEIAVDYVHGKEEKHLIEKSSYDKCLLLFSLRNIWLKSNSKNFIKDIYDYLKNDGEIHIWDIDKGLLKGFNGKVKLVLPEDTIKEINIRDFNIFKDTSKKNTIKLLENYFEIIDLKHFDNIYYIKGKKLVSRSSNKDTTIYT